jgi:mannose-6-phosphate isomerase-like protein (cupin superfamily)
MVEREVNRVRERGAIEQTPYEIFLRSRKEFDERQNTGPIVIRPSDREYQITRQGRMFYYLNAQAFKETPLHDWRVFTQDIKTHSGKHRHQGGFVIYVIEGRGYSIVDGERVDWEEGDLFLLPIKPNGIEHQHFNTDPSKGCRWIAFCYMPIFDHLASEFTQMEVSPLMKG